MQAGTLVSQHTRNLCSDSIVLGFLCLYPRSPFYVCTKKKKKTGVSPTALVFVRFFLSVNSYERDKRENKKVERCSSLPLALAVTHSWGMQLQRRDSDKMPVGENQTLRSGAAALDHTVNNMSARNGRGPHRGSDGADWV